MPVFFLTNIIFYSIKIVGDTIFFIEFSTIIYMVFFQAFDTHLLSFVTGTFLFKWRYNIFRQLPGLKVLPSSSLHGSLRGHRCPVMERVSINLSAHMSAVTSMSCCQLTDNDCQNGINREMESNLRNIKL